MKMSITNSLIRSSHLCRRFFVRFYSDVGVSLNTLNSKIPSTEGRQYDVTSYYFENGLRKVYPYHCTFYAHVKARWVGLKITELYAKEFRLRPLEEYEFNLRSGRFRVNGGIVDVDYCIKPNDQLANTIHMHELPVTAAPVKIVHEDADFVVVDKPSSIHVHPNGRYCHNTVLYILAREHGMKDIKPLHRIDRLTSGLLMFGRNDRMTGLVFDQMTKRLVEKEYVCRVQGHFPRGTIECHEPIVRIPGKLFVSKVSPTGKHCSTEFELISHGSTSSVVRCRPRTGRSHQIRVHLQYLGYPIVNDPLYNNTAFGLNKAKGGLTEVTEEQLLANLWEKDHPGGVVESRDQTAHVGPQVGGPASPQQLSGTITDACRDDRGFKPHLHIIDETCSDCKVKYKDPKPEDLVMYLHALKYKGPGWKFETKLPDWAASDWMDKQKHTLDGK